MELINAAKNCDFDLAFSLITSKYPVNGRDGDNATPLYWSAIRGHAHMCDVLVQAGCDVNARVKWGSTALHAAADRGHTECVDVLINSGVDIDGQNNRGDTALHIASYRGHSDIVRLLVEAGAHLNLGNVRGQTAIQEAKAGSHRDIANFLSAAMTGSPERANGVQEPLPKHVTNHVTQNGSHARYSLSSGSASLADSQLSSMDTSLDTSYSSGVTVSETLDLSAVNEQRLPRNITQEINESVFVNSNSPSEHEERHQSLNLEAHKNNRYFAYRRSLSTGDYDRGNLTLINKQEVNDIQPEVGTDSFESINPNQRAETSSFDDSVCDPYVSSSSDTTCDRHSSDIQQPGSIHMRNPALHRLSGRPLRSSTGSLVGEVTLYNAIETYAATLHENMLEANIKLEKANQQNEVLCKQVRDLSTQCLTYKTEFERLSRENGTGVSSEVQQLTDTRALSPRTGRKQMTTTEQQNSSDQSRSVTHKGLQNLFISVFSTGDKAMTKDCFCRHTKQTVRQLFLSQLPPRPIDHPGRQWTPGVDFVILGGKPASGVVPVGGIMTFYLAFQIKHVKTKCKYELKMKWNQVTSSYQHRGTSGSSGSFQTDLSEIHPNMAPLVHRYDAPTDRFQRFIVQMAQEYSLEINPPKWTTFSVTPYYTNSLANFEAGIEANTVLEIYGSKCTFLAYVLYYMLSVLCLLSDRNIVHRNIHAGTIFLDAHYRPILGSFELARTVREPDGAPIVFSSRQDILSGNESAWAPELVRAYNNGPSMTQKACLPDIYASSDLYALGKAVQTIALRTEYSAERTQSPGITCNWLPELPVGLRSILGLIALDDPGNRMAPTKAMAALGALMLMPTPEEVRTQDSALSYCQSRLLKLLSIDTGHGATCKTGNAKANAGHSHRCVDDVRLETEAHFLCNFSSLELWETCQELRKMN